MEEKRLGHYELQELLGKGGMGEVWLARDHKLERDVALKFLHPGLGLDEGRRSGSCAKRGPPLPSTTRESSRSTPSSVNQDAPSS